MTRVQFRAKSWIKIGLKNVEKFKRDVSENELQQKYK